MSYSVSFQTCNPRDFYTTKGTPYEHWIACNRSQDARYMHLYSNYATLSAFILVFIPSLKLYFIRFFNGYISIATIDIDDVLKVIHVTAVTTIKNWPNRNIFEHTGYHNTFVRVMFGMDWNINLTDNIPTVSVACEHIFNTLLYETVFGRCNQVIGTIYITENAAATIIQKWFRGWQARLKYRFDPTNRFGRFCEEMQFKALQYA